MSLESWKKEFYPIPADECPEEEAIEHSLRKWRGLTQENLEKHEMAKDPTFSRIQEKKNPSRGFAINGETCALCEQWIDYEAPDTAHDPDNFCPDCPLNISLGGVPCDRPYMPYAIYQTEGNPRPMIGALEATLDMKRKRRKRAKTPKKHHAKIVIKLAQEDIDNYRRLSPEEKKRIKEEALSGELRRAAESMRELADYRPEQEPQEKEIHDKKLP